MHFYDGHIVVFGGTGAVGSSCISMFKANNWWAASIEISTNLLSKDSLTKGTTLSITKTYTENPPYDNLNKQADLNVLVNPRKDITEMETEILAAIGKGLDGSKLDAVICMAGSFEGGNANQRLSATMDFMWKENVWPSILSTSIAVTYMREGGFLCLFGARAALQPTPSMIGYGLAKAAIHQLTKSLAAEDSALPANSLCVALLPLTIDTIMNKHVNTMKDIAGWTPTKYITDLLFKWCNGKECPANGSLVQFTTGNFKTDIFVVE